MKYTGLVPLRKDFDEIESLGKEGGILSGTAKFDDYVDASFSTNDAALQAYQWEAPKP